MLIEEKEAEVVAKIGMSLVLETIEREKHEKYRCKLIEQSESLLFVDYPINELNGKTAFFMTGTKFIASFVGLDGSVYQFVTELKNKANIKIPALALSYPGDEGLKRIQRRDYVRIASTNDIAIHAKAMEFPPFTTVTTNISGGGLAFLLPEQISLLPGNKLDAWLVLYLESGIVKHLQLEAVVIRTKQGKEGRSNTVSIQFEEIDDQTRQTIIRYCFERQLRERRQKLN